MRRIKKNQFISLLVLLGMFAFFGSYALDAEPASAALGLERVKRIATEQGLTQKEPKALVKQVILWLLSFSAVIALAALIWAGFLYITSLADEEKVKKAKRVALYAIGGLIFMVAAFVIIQVIGDTFAEI